MRRRLARLVTVSAAPTLVVAMAAGPARADVTPIGSPPVIGGGRAPLVEPLPTTPPPLNPTLEVPTSSQLADVARTAIRARNEFLVTGTVQPGSSSSTTTSVTYSVWLAAAIPDLQAQRTELTATSVAYTGHAETLTIDSVVATPAVVTLVADVESRYGMTGINGNVGVPASTATGEQLHFVFTNSGTTWALQRVDTNDVGGLYYESEGTLQDELTDTHNPPGQPVADAVAPVVVDVNAVPSVDVSDVRDSDDTARKFADRGDMVAYAIAHSGVNGHSVNGSYHFFKGSDCTNFVSQSLVAGGWPMTPRFNGDPYREWWYNSASDYVGSWTVAWQLYYFIDDNEWSRPIPTQSAFRPGDVLQADLEKYHHGKIHHSTVVTARDSKGNLYLTYHSAMNENKPFVQFMRAAGNATKIYGWDVN